MPGLQSSSSWQSRAQLPNLHSAENGHELPSAPQPEQMPPAASRLHVRPPVQSALDRQSIGRAGCPPDPAWPACPPLPEPPPDPPPCPPLPAEPPVALEPPTPEPALAPEPPLPDAPPDPAVPELPAALPPLDEPALLPPTELPPAPELPPTAPLPPLDEPALPPAPPVEPPPDELSSALAQAIAVAAPIEITQIQRIWHPHSTRSESLSGHGGGSGKLCSGIGLCRSSLVLPGNPALGPYSRSMASQLDDPAPAPRPRSDSEHSLSQLFSKIEPAAGTDSLRDAVQVVQRPRAKRSVPPPPSPALMAQLEHRPQPPAFSAPEPTMEIDVEEVGDVGDSMSVDEVDGEWLSVDDAVSEEIAMDVDVEEAQDETEAAGSDASEPDAAVDSEPVVAGASPLEATITLAPSEIEVACEAEAPATNPEPTLELTTEELEADAAADDQLKTEVQDRPPFHSEPPRAVPAAALVEPLPQRASAPMPRPMPRSSAPPPRIELPPVPKLLPKRKMANTRRAELVVSRPPAAYDGEDPSTITKVVVDHGVAPAALPPVPLPPRSFQSRPPLASRQPTPVPPVAVPARTASTLPPKPAADQAAAEPSVPRQSAPPSAFPPVVGPIFRDRSAPQASSRSTMAPMAISEPPPAHTSRSARIAITAFAATLGLGMLAGSAALFAQGDPSPAGRGDGSLAVAVTGPGLSPIDRVEVFVDGQRRCDTSPCRVEKFEGDNHIVKAIAPGYESQTLHNVSADVQGGILRLVMRPVAPQANSDVLAVTVPAAAPATQPEVASVESLPIAKAEPVAAAPARAAASPRRSAPVARRTAPAPSPKSTEPGMLRIGSRPLAKVAVDGRPLGMTPKVLSMPAGSHTVVFMYEGERQVRTVNVDPGGTTRVAAKF